MKMVELLLQRWHAKLDGDALVARARGEDELAVVSGLAMVRRGAEKTEAARCCCGGDGDGAKEEDGCAAVAADWWCWCVAGNGVMVMQWWPAR